MLLVEAKSDFIRQTAIIVCLACILNNPAIAKETSDWRTDYNVMTQAYQFSDYDKASEFAKSALGKVLKVDNATERSVGVDQILQKLNQLNYRYQKQMKYPQQESVLKAILKAEQSKNDGTSTFQITQTKKDLAVCLVLQGKDKEAEEYSPKNHTLNEEKGNRTGWKKDFELLSVANRTDDRDNIYKYALKAVDEAITVEDVTEQEVAFDQILQQLQTARYKFSGGKNYADEEKILKLTLKIEEVQDMKNAAEPTLFGFGLNGYSSVATLKELVTCLVMEGKNDEAAIYDAQYKEKNAKLMQRVQDFQKNLQDQVLKLQASGKDKSDSKEIK